jgi:alpha-beta hydrolase superfamily lysophospholipase
VKRRLAIGAAVVLAVLVIAAVAQVPSIAAHALLHPVKGQGSTTPPPGCADETFDGAGVRLHGWRCSTTARRRGTVVLLHGVADTRASMRGLAQRFVAERLDVVAYDSRAHGTSGGAFCTYGYFEKDDLRRIVEALPAGPVVLLGTSLGAAVALQAAAHHPRVAGVVAAEVFADLKSIARHRTPAFIPGWMIASAFRRAEARAGFVADEVSPVRAAEAIRVPVFLVHGGADTSTPPSHSERVLAALRGPKRLLLVDGARHNESLRAAAVWRQIDEWMDQVVGAPQ